MKKFIFTVIAVAAFSFLHAQSPTDSLQEFTGKYKFPDGGPISELSIVIDKGALWANSAAGNSELRRTQGDVFEVIAYSGYATFKRSAEGKVNGIKVELEDLLMEGTKTETPAISEAFFKTRTSALSMQLVE